MPTTAAELLGQYTEYCNMLRVRKPCSAVLTALKGLHADQAAAKQAHADAHAAVRAAAREDGECDSESDRIEITPAAVAPIRLPALRHLDLSRTYLGGRGLLAVASLCRHLTELECLDVSDAQWFSCDGRPSAPAGHETLTLFCKLVIGHPKLSTIVLGTVDFGPSQYLWLVELLKNSPSLTSVRLAAPNLAPNEAAMLEALGTVNAKRKERRSAFDGRVAASNPLQDDIVEVSSPVATDPGDAAEDSTTDVGAQSTTSKSMIGLTLARSAASTMFRGVGGHGGVEGVIRGVGEPTASLLVGPSMPHSRKVQAALQPPAQAPELTDALLAAFDRNGVLRHIPVDDRRVVALSMRRAVYAAEEIIVEQNDMVDGVGLVTAGGAVSIRSDDVSMLHPCFSLVGEEEMMPGMLTDTRRFTVRAQPSLVSQPLRKTIEERESKRQRRGTQVYAEADSPAALPGVTVAQQETRGAADSDRATTPSTPPEKVEVWWIPRNAFKTHCIRMAHENRQHWRRLIDLLPCMQGLGTMAKLAVADVLDERRATAGEVLSAGFSMLADVFIVIDGSATVYFQNTPLKKLVRGELFACHPKTDVARCSVVANEPGACVAYIPPGLFLSLPQHVQEHIAAIARTFTLMDEPQ